MAPAPAWATSAVKATSRGIRARRAGCMAGSFVLGWWRAGQASSAPRCARWIRRRPGAGHPEEADIITALARKGGMPELTTEAVDQGNAGEASAHAAVDKGAAIALVRDTVAVAAAMVRELTEAELDRVAPTALHWGAPLTVQFFVEHHPIAHPYMHLASIRAALET